ncbi:MAG: hypothetical protein K2I64_05320 [Muribaculaceae bacterium]|nr:hypothetical protein [Muribaculaceae bacterium]
MLKKFPLYLATAISAFAFASCDKDSNYETNTDYASTLVKSFSLQANPKILNNLDTVYFSIDLVKGRIFNADSLPFGTKVNRLQVSVTTDNCSAVEFHIPRPGQTDSIINYLEHSTDSIDFSNGAVRLHVVSFDRLASRDYSVEVNVHKTVADSLLWLVNEIAKVPSSFAAPTATATAQLGKELYTLSTDGSAYCLHKASNPLDPGTATEVTFSFTPRIATLTATRSALFILADNGDLYSSADGTSWTACGECWYSITAPYGDSLLGIALTDGVYTHVTYPASSAAPIAVDFPISGNSQAIAYTTQWSPDAQIITLGGRKADGTTAPSVWAYDGSSWAKVADNTPMSVDGAVMFPYFVCETDTNTWVTTTRTVFVALGGRQNDNTINGTTYISYDLGFNWKKAPDLMQQPARFPAIYTSRAYIYNETLTSRAVKPITEWDTPYIYIYGGTDIYGTAWPYVLKGVINRLQFKPLQ